MFLKKKMILFISLLLLLANIGCSAGANKGENEKPILKIGYLPITHASPLFLNQHIHDGEHEGYEVELVKFGSWPDLMDALNTGRIDGASVLIQLAMKSVEKGIDLSAVALGHQDGNALISAKGIDSIQDIKGESFAIPHTYSTHHLLLQELLTLEGMDYDDIDIVELPPAEMPVALSEERIEGYVVAEPFGALGLHLDIGEVLAFSEDFWPDSYCCVLVLRDDFIDSNFGVAEDYVKSYVEAGKKADEKGSDLYEALQDYMKVEDETLDISLEWITFDNLSIEKAEYDKILKKVMDLELMESPPKYEELVDNRFIDRAKLD